MTKTVTLTKAQLSGLIAGKAAKASVPWMTIMVVAMIIARFAFHVNIAWLWILAPYWIFPAFFLAVLMTIAMVGGLALLGIMGLTWITMHWPLQKRHAS